VSVELRMIKDGKDCILIVDDEALNLAVLTDLFKGQYQILVAKDGEQALRRAAGTPRPDFILLDIMMPGMDGYTVCRHLKADPATRGIPVMFVSALDQEDNEAFGIELGAVDYLTKPISPPVAKARVKAHLAAHRQAASMERLVAERTRALVATRDATISALANLAEARDNDTGDHIRRTQAYVHILAEELRGHPKFRQFLTEPHIELLYKSAMLHDIGKVGIPDRILLKPGPLTAEEYATMKHHTVIGRDTLLAAEAMLDEESNFLHFARDTAYTHHERWDGRGYPQGLAGEQIPLCGRLMALADVYDALVSRRVYKLAFSHDEAARIILGERGRQFDPDVVDAFHAAQMQFREVAKRPGTEGEPADRLQCAVK